ncbi:MAG: autotransporter domain-containing protein [Sutterella wadsworthensis]
MKSFLPRLNRKSLDTYRTLDDDFYATARNALVVNATAVSRTVMDQARGMGEGRSAEVDNGRARIWAAGIGHWGEAEGTKNTMDVDFRTGFLGAEALVLDNTKVGAFFGYGTTDYKSGLNKIDGEDKHFGVYGLTDIGNVTMTLRRGLHRRRS